MWEPNWVLHASINTHEESREGIEETQRGHEEIVIGSVPCDVTSVHWRIWHGVTSVCPLRLRFNEVVPDINSNKPEPARPIKTPRNHLAGCRLFRLAQLVSQTKFPSYGSFVQHHRWLVCILDLGVNLSPFALAIPCSVR